MSVALGSLLLRTSDVLAVTILGLRKLGELLVDAGDPTVPF